MNRDDSELAAPWWRFPMMWLVVGGPLLVVVASFATLFLAVRGGDTPVRDAERTPAAPLKPAVQARNHAATAPR